MNSTLRRIRFALLALLLSLALPSGHLLAQDFTVNLKETDIQELIKFVAEVTGTTIVVDPAVKGKVKVVSSKPVSKDELYDLFLSILEVHGYTAVRSGGVVRVIQSKDARSSPVSVADDGPRGSDEYMTQVIRLDNISAAKLIPVLRPLVPQQAHMAAYAPSNAIIISDVSANIDRIKDIIQRMDRSAVQKTDIIKLRYAVADDVVAMLDKLNKSEAKQSGGAEPEVLLVADSRTNSVLVSGDEMERARMSQLIKHLDTPLEQSGNVRVVYLEYADAKEIAEVLTRVMQNINSLENADGKAQRSNAKTATIEADEGTNSLIITAETDEMAAIESVIHRLDIRRAQVLVEAIIVEMTFSEGQDLGLQWLFANTDSGFYGSNINSPSQAQQLAGALNPDNGDEATPSNDIEFDVGALAGALASTPGLSLGWGSVDDDLTMTVILNALKTQGNANILSTPSLLTLDNQEAFITVGQNVPFITGSYTNSGSSDGASNPFQTIERQNVGITLAVTPHINEGDSVVLEIEQEVSNVIIGASQISEAADIITSERKIQTKVLAQDSKVVVLGGLIEDNVQDGQQKVPILGDIPFLGRLFRTDSVDVSKTNLLIFIRPTIIRDNAQLDGATADKYRYIRDQQLLRREQGLMFLDDGNLPVLPEWEEQIQQLEEIKEASSIAEPEAK
ncbi:type II secretion system protein GspD [Halieaceae bacterium IMCC8485]|uniref:Type II secretion system protein GspD n=1 Tax=Candidatus Seongchinamella marina TaxID=2518990 RepID=A0ABT3SSE5_9GAMM|nr:type II secretion system secretin GspD [Candidatus Seongchinamella marina]MCX2972242.1 type II secretion system protein GspD [Candidatus Seongchinamella marina]